MVIFPLLGWKVVWGWPSSWSKSWLVPWLVMAMLNVISFRKEDNFAQDFSVTALSKGAMPEDMTSKSQEPCVAHTAPPLWYVFLVWSSWQPSTSHRKCDLPKDTQLIFRQAKINLADSLRPAVSRTMGLDLYPLDGSGGAESTHGPASSGMQVKDWSYA